MAVRTHAIEIEQFGGPEELNWVEYDLAPPAPGELLIRHTAIGLNFIDCYHRSGLYPIDLPAVPGLEGAGVVEAVGDGVKGFQNGDRVAYGGGALGAYATYRHIAAAAVVKLPDAIDDKTAAAMMLKGCTAEYLIRRAYKVEKGDTVLLHAAAGGVGLIACQWLKALGATVIGTAGSPEKIAVARAHGADHMINYRDPDWADQVRALAPQGLPVAFDGVGRETFMGSLDCLRPRGLMISYGNASGPVENFSLGILAAKGSLYVTRPTLAHYYGARQELEAGSQALFDIVARGDVKIEIHQEYALKDAAQAHRDLEARKTTGSTVLLP